MTSPQTLSGVGIFSSLFGGLTQAMGAKQLGAAQAQMYNYQAGVAETNRQIAEQNRVYALQAGEITAEQYGIKAAQTEGQIKAAQGASNIDVNVGSTVAVQAGQRKVAAMDLDQIRQNAARVAYGYETEAVQAQAQAGLYGMAAKTAVLAGDISATSSLVSTAGSVSDKWLQAQQYGILGSGSTNILKTQDRLV